MKKYFNKRFILLLIALVYVFFAGFKFLKGKSFFDTIVEYSNNIHSINAEIKEVNKDDYNLEKLEYIPVKYVDYRNFESSKYIVRKENSNDLYIYDTLESKEVLFEDIKETTNMSGLTVNEKWVIWVESTVRDSENGCKGLIWSIYAKAINGEEKTLIEEGSSNLSGLNPSSYMEFIPKEIILDGNNIIYIKSNENTINKSNIITTTVMTSIIRYDLEKSESKIIDSSYDDNRVSLYDIKIDQGNLIWQKIYKDARNEVVTKAEVQFYNMNTEKKEKIFETSSISNLDISGENIVIVANNPEDNIVIYNMKDKSSDNIFYKGSRIEKALRVAEDIPIITKVEFINDNYILIGISSTKTTTSAIVYDIKSNVFREFDTLIKEKELNPLAQYNVKENQLLIYVGMVARVEQESEESEKIEMDDKQEKKDIKEIYISSEEISDYKKEEIDNNIFDDNTAEKSDEVYYKYYIYKLM